MLLDCPSYVDADHDLEQRLQSELSNNQRTSLKRLHVAVASGIVTLSGCVRSFYERQLAVQCCRRVAGVTQMIDAVEVA
ncbi:MAG: BON domain-containing protein [Pirellulales bacterium]